MASGAQSLGNSRQLAELSNRREEGGRSMEEEEEEVVVVT